ncbi:hypothetical protein LTR37_004347 [Vermiconidia calcicola]|uniref:Uncharacterized protein n=1 Tax=Vermiconidia calcicola TaxID=1690605 RepID=A0ACC3NM57_9PEZI|nr:hypothetical protein LTR37_004347 [Vermiconidia calcicola]
MAQPIDWLGSLLERELSAVIAWRKNVQGPSKVKHDPDGRFSDDGSNYRCDVAASNLPTDTRVQVCKVISAKDPVTVLVSDGFTKVRARLSKAAVATLEAEIEESVDLETKGDVFTIQHATIVSTPIGPPDENIQLEIERIQYEYHLRKQIGQPKAIQERGEAQLLIQQVLILLQQQYAIGRESIVEPTSPDTVAGALQEDPRLNSQRSNGTPNSQRSRPGSQASPLATQQSFLTQRPIATQVPSRRKPTGPTLLKDGFEVASGVNLDGPKGAGLSAPGRGLSATVREPLTVAVEGTSTKKLLGLLDKRKAVQPPQETIQVSDVSQTPTSPVRKAQKTSSQDAGPRIVEQISVPTPPSAQTAPINATAAKSQQRDYSRRRIPKDQMKLLDNASAWLPSLPGKQFPHPNVPIELLKRWKSQASTIPQNGTTTKAQATSRPEAVDNVVDSSSASSSDDESSENEELPPPRRSSEDVELPPSQWSQSPPSPRRQRPMLPPDSTMESTDKPSPTRSRRELPPDSSNESNKLSPSQRAQPPRYEDLHNSADKFSPMRSRRELPPDSSNESNRLSPSRRAQPRPYENVHNSMNRPSPRQRRPERPPDSSNADSNMGPPWQRTTRRLQGSENKRRHEASPLERRPQAPPSKSSGGNDVTSPSQKGQERPPLSSNESTNRPLSLQQRPEREYHSSYESSIRPSSPYRRPSVNEGSRIDSQRKPCPLPNRPDWIQQDVVGSSPAQASPSQRSVGSRPGSSNSRIAYQSPQHSRSQPQYMDGARESSPRHPASQSIQQQHPLAHGSPIAPTVSQQAATTPDQSPASRQQTRVSATDTPTSVVKGTQLNEDDGEDDVMEIEMSVPRSLDQDPMVVHRERRREHFKKAQRRQWILQNYVSDRRLESSNFTSVFTTYTNSHPSDVVKPSEFAESIKEAFPVSEDGTPKLNLKSPKKEENVASSPLLAKETSTADAFGGAVETPGRFSERGGTQGGEVEWRLGKDEAEGSVRREERAGMRSRGASFARSSLGVDGGGDEATPASPGRRLPWAASAVPRCLSGVQQSGESLAGTPSKTASSTFAHRMENTRSTGGSVANINQTAVLKEQRNDVRKTPTYREADERASKLVEVKERKDVSKSNGVAIEPSPIFAEFAHAWKKLGPGGAFAEPRLEDSARRRSQLNVLAWEL